MGATILSVSGTNASQAFAKSCTHWSSSQSVCIPHNIASFAGTDPEFW